MTGELAGRYVTGVVVILLVWLAIGAWRLRRRRVIVGPAAAGAMHELLSNDRRAAVEIILEERTGERDPEDRDGNLPELEDPSSKAITYLANPAVAGRPFTSRE